MPVGRWTHVLITRASGNLKLYLDGVLDATGFWTGAFAPTAAGKGVTPFYLHGSLDDLVMYDRALSASEIQQLVGPRNLALGHRDAITRRVV